MLRIAVAQTPGSRLDEWPRTHALVEELIQRAASKNADVVLFPECVWPAYFIGSTDDYFRAREAGMPSDRWFLAQLAVWARTHRVGVCAGYVAEDVAAECRPARIHRLETAATDQEAAGPGTARRERRLFNAASLISEAGEVLGTYRKCFLWDFDHAFFEAGDSIAPVDTPCGPVGLMICADTRLPEIAATLAAGGARLFLQPTAWVNCGPPEELWNPQPELLIPERAREFGVPMASASKWGVEGETTFVGSSLICDAAGNVLAQCGTSETQLIVADVSAETPRKPELTPEQRARLLAREPAELPRANVPPLRAVLVKEASQVQAALKEVGRALPADLRTSGRARPTRLPTLFLLQSPVPHRPVADLERGDNWLLLAGPTGEIHSLGAARLAAVRDQDAEGFAAIRVLALGGVHLVVVFGENVSVRALRSRAAENRVFLIHVTTSGIVGYDPQGDEVGRASAYVAARSGDAKLPGLELDAAQAANKEFAPQTNPFTARKPELYAF